MADHLEQLLVAIEDVKQLASSQDQAFSHMRLALKVVEMRDHFQLEELASLFSVHDFVAYIIGLHLAVKRVKFIMRRCLDRGWIQAVLQNGTNEEELREILIDLDQFCRQMCTAMLKNTKGDSCGQMNSMFIPREYKGFQELLERREEVVDLYHNKVLHKLEKEIDAAHESGKLKEREFIARVLQKLKDGKEIGDLLNIKWGKVVDGSYLGQGAFGSVMESNLFGEALAFKSLIAKSREAEIQATLHHPNIVQILCCLQSEKGRFLVMELMSMDLRQYLKENEQGFALPVAIDMILQIARSVYYLHCRSVAHLDLKSANIMVKVPDSPDGYVQVKLGDFGSAKIGLSAEDQNVGTTRYRAPEISVNPEGIQQDLAKADVYSFALTCYHILTCQEPFAKTGDDHLWKEEVELERRPQFSECCPPELVSLISRCWATDPMIRPDFKTICDELQPVFTRLSGDITVTCGPTFIGEGNVEDLAEAPNDDLKYGNMPLAALNPLKHGIYLESIDEFEEALMKYNEASGVQPANLYILERRGHVNRILGKLSEALNDLNEANKLDPEYADVLVERGIVKMKTGDHLGALEDLDEYIILRPEKTFGFYVRGRIKLSFNLYEEALVDFDQAQNLGREDSSLFSHRASTKMALEDYRGAIADFDAISPSRITPDDLCLRGTSKACLSNIKGALEDYDKAVRLSQYDPFILRARASIKLSCFDTKGAMEDSLKASESTYPSVDFQDLVFRGQVRSRLNDFHGTLEELNTVREHEAQNPSFWGFQAYQKSKVNDMRGALRDIEKAIELDSNIPLHLSWRGQIKSMLDDVEGASVDFEKVRELDSGNAALVWNRASFRSSLCDYYGALSDLNMILEFDPTNWNVIFLRGEAKRMLHDFEGAFADYSEASILKPGDPNIWTQLGYVKHILQYDIFLSLADFSKAIDLQPQCSLALKFRGFLRIFLKDYAASLVDLDIAHRLQPYDTQILIARAQVKSCLSDIQGAMQDFDKAVILNPNDPFILRARASIKLSCFDTKGAMEDSLKASESTYPSVDFQDLVFRGQVRSRLNDFHGTLEELNTVREHEAQNPSFWGFQAYQKSKVNDMRGALRDIEKAIELDSNIPLHLSWRGQIKSMLDDVEGASVDFEKVRELDSGNAALVWNRASFRSSLCDYYGALSDLNMILEFDPTNWNVIFLRGEAKRMLHDFEGALTDYTEANRINPNNNMILTCMESMKEILKDIVGGLAHLNNLNEQQVINGMAYLCRGRMRGLLKDYAASLEDLDIAHKLQPYNPQILIARAWVKSLTEDLEGALEDQQKAMLLEGSGDQLSFFQKGYQHYFFLRKIRFFLVRFLLFLFLLWVILVILEIAGIYEDPFDPLLAALLTCLRNWIADVIEYVRNRVHSTISITLANSSVTI